MTHEYDINTESEEFKRRCTDVKALLTPRKIANIVMRNRERVTKEIDAVEKRCVFIIFTSTASLLRCVRGGDEKVFNVASVTLAEARKCIPDSSVLNACEEPMEFCCIIATARPIMPHEAAASSPLTVHILTRMSVIAFDVECALHGADEVATPALKESK